MTPGYYHNPPKSVSTRVRCPVCHEDVYSRADIHPQCAVRKAEQSEPKGKAKGLPNSFMPNNRGWRKGRGHHRSSDS
jgi:hypothetical protein